MVQTVAVANDIINRAWHWFMGFEVGINENSLKNESLSQNVPNPCNSTTAIQFTLPSSEQVSLDLYDINGRSVQHILHGITSAGNHQVNINTSSFDAGVYYYTLLTSSGKLTRKMIVVK
jgi:NADH:ubiquinone oxidoreductase subunit F (NADH-binding)